MSCLTLTPTYSSAASGQRADLIHTMTKRSTETQYKYTTGATSNLATVHNECELSDCPLENEFPLIGHYKEGTRRKILNRFKPRNIPYPHQLCDCNRMGWTRVVPQWGIPKKPETEVRRTSPSTQTRARGEAVGVRTVCA